MKGLKITLSGTRGKSTVARNLHKIFHENRYNVLSRETGLFPVVYYNENEIFLKRESTMPLNRLLEAKVILDLFNKDKKEILIFENNAIRGPYMRGFNEFIHPDIVIITTVTPDHVLDQGSTLEETIETFLESVPNYSFVVFWTNHKCEYNAIKKMLAARKSKGVVLFSSLDEREKVILESMQPVLKAHGIKLKKPMDKAQKTDGMKEISGKIGNRHFINLGHINDPVHTYMAFASILHQNPKTLYLLFNFRADRPERVPLFVDAFLPFVKEFVQGVIVYSDSIALSSDFIINNIKDKYASEGDNIKLYSCKSYQEFVKRVLPRLPGGATVVMVGNTANEFGFEAINQLKLFRDSYPVLNEVKISGGVVASSE